MLTHLEASLQQDINRIRANITTMSGLAERALLDCVQAYREKNLQLAYSVILRDQYIDEKEKEIDRLCLEFILRQQPIGAHLRFAFSTIKINLEIKRVGDYAESIARYLLRVDERPEPAVVEGIVNLATLASGMLNGASKAFVNQDTALAKKIIEQEEAADLMRSQLSQTMVAAFNDKKLSFTALESHLSIIRRFERVADQARNICIEVLYMCTGENIKHPGAEAFRILFVDKHNSRQSLMAEAIGNSLNQSRFIFNSAGLEPRPIDAPTMEFMKQKGFDISSMVPKSIHHIPNLEHYQVIVALSKDMSRAFSQLSSKTVFLDWEVDTQILQKGEEVPIQQKCEVVYPFLYSHITNLVEAILRTNNKT